MHQPNYFPYELLLMDLVPLILKLIKIDTVMLLARGEQSLNGEKQRILIH